MQLIRWLWYAFRLIVYAVQGVLRFISKPGSRIIVPVAIIAFAFLARQTMHQAISGQAQRIDAGYQPESGLLDAATVITVVVAIIAYVLASRILAVTLGAFPVAMRPLPPQRKLKPTKTAITSAPVRVVVPPLPR